MNGTKIELEDYNGNTLYVIEIDQHINHEQIKINGFEWADSEGNGWHYRYQKILRD